MRRGRRKRRVGTKFMRLDMSGPIGMEGTGEGAVYFTGTGDGAILRDIVGRTGASRYAEDEDAENGVTGMEYS